MNNEKKFFKDFNTISIFFTIYLLPLILNFYQTGPSLIGNKYQTEISYIQNLNDLFNHLFNNFSSYLNLFINPIFWFFVSAFFTQKTIKWLNSN